MDGYICFVPDLVVYDVNGMRVFVEVEYKNPVDKYKLWKIIMWSIQHKINPLVIQVKAEWIMKQIQPPKDLICEVLYDRYFSNFE